jgi:hypothetical protein
MEKQRNPAGGSQNFHSYLWHPGFIQLENSGGNEHPMNLAAEPPNAVPTNTPYPPFYRPPVYLEQSQHQEIVVAQDNTMLIFLILGFCFPLLWASGFFFLFNSVSRTRALARASVVLFVIFVVSVIALAVYHPSLVNSLPNLM